MFALALLAAQSTSGPVELSTAPIPLESTPVALITLDLNNDGSDEIVSFHNDPARYQIHTIAPDGSYAQHPTVLLPNDNIIRAYRADMNADARPDIVIVYQNSTRVRTLLNDGLGGLSAPPSLVTDLGTGVLTTAVSDITNDGLPDVIVAASRTLRIYPNFGDGRLMVPLPSIAIPPSTITAITTADPRAVDADDIFVLSGNVVYAVHRVQNNTFTQATSFSVSTSAAMHATDVDADGREDIITVSNNALGARVTRYNRTTGTYQTLTQPGFPSGPGATPAGFADINSDGVDDVLLVFPNAAGPAALLASSTPPYFPRTDRIPGHLHQVRLLAPLHTIDDDRTSLVAATSAPPALIIFTQSDTGQFDYGAVVTTPSAPPARMIRMNDRDGRPDFLIGSSGANPVLALTLIAGPGKTPAFVERTLPGLPSGLAPQHGWTLGDLNADGQQDVAHTVASGSNRSLRWHLGSPDGMFEAQPDRPVPGVNQLLSPTFVDLNADGYDDIVALASDGAVRIIYGSADPAPPDTIVQPLSSRPAPTNLAVSDLDRDGVPDLLCLGGRTNQTNTISIAFGRPGGGFEDPAEFPTLPSAGAIGLGFIATGDINSDGLTDIIVRSATAAAIHFADAPRSFGPPVQFAQGELTNLWVGDLNNDRRDEIAVTATGSTTLYALDDASRLITRGRFVHPRDATDFILLDADDDARTDVIVAAPSGILIVRNQSPSPCLADYDSDSIIDIFDVARFITDWNAGIPRADFNDDARFDFFDIARFIQIYSAGCP